MFRGLQSDDQPDLNYIPYFGDDANASVLADVYRLQYVHVIVVGVHMCRVCVRRVVAWCRTRQDLDAARALEFDTDCTVAALCALIHHLSYCKRHTSHQAVVGTGRSAARLMADALAASFCVDDADDRRMVTSELAACAAVGTPPIVVRPPNSSHAGTQRPCAKTKPLHAAVSAAAHACITTATCRKAMTDYVSAIPYTLHHFPCGVKDVAGLSCTQGVVRGPSALPHLNSDLAARSYDALIGLPPLPDGVVSNPALVRDLEVETDTYSCELRRMWLSAPSALIAGVVCGVCSAVLSPMLRV